MSQYETLDVRVDGRGVATVTLDRPDVRNAFNAQMIGEITAGMQALAADHDVRVVVLTGAGSAFSAGADLNWMGSMREYNHDENVADAKRMNQMLRSIYDMPKPVIARVNGHAIAGGTGLVAVCDIVVAVEYAKLGLTEVVLGLAPAVISPYVVRKIGISHARALFVTGELFDAVHAFRIGLLHQLVADTDELDTAVQATIERCLKAGPEAVAVAKSLPDLAGGPLEDVTRKTPEIIARLRVGEEGQEGIAAFFDKRSAAWVPSEEGQ